MKRTRISGFAWRLGAFIVAVALAHAGAAHASGAPSITYTSRLYRLNLASQVSVTPEDDDSSYFADEEQAYRRRLEPIVGRIDAAVERARQRLGLLPYDPAHREPVDETGGSALPRRVFARAKVGGAFELSLALSASRLIDQPSLDALAREVARIVAAAKDDAPPPSTANLIERQETKIAHPGLELTVRPEARWIVARHKDAILKRDTLLVLLVNRRATKVRDEVARPATCRSVERVARSVALQPSGYTR